MTATAGLAGDEYSFYWQLSNMASLLDLPPGGPPGGRSRSRDSDETVQIALEEALGAPATAGESEGGPGESGCVPAMSALAALEEEDRHGTTGDTLSDALVRMDRILAMKNVDEDDQATAAALADALLQRAFASEGGSSSAARSGSDSGGSSARNALNLAKEEDRHRGGSARAHRSGGVGGKSGEAEEAETVAAELNMQQQAMLWRAHRVLAEVSHLGTWQHTATQQQQQQQRQFTLTRNGRGNNAPGHFESTPPPLPSPAPVPSAAAAGEPAVSDGGEPRGLQPTTAAATAAATATATATAAATTGPALPLGAWHRAPTERWPNESGRRD